MFLAMKSTTGWILAGSAHPTHVTPVMGKARSWRARTTLDVTDAPSSLSAAEPHGRQALFLDAPPKAAPATSTLAELSAPSRSESSSSASSPSSSYSRTCRLRFALPPRSFFPPRSLAVLEAPSRSPRPRISSSIMEMGPNMDVPTLAFAAARAAAPPPPCPAAAAQTGCCGGAAPAFVCGKSFAPTASPAGSGGADSLSLLSDMVGAAKGSHLYTQTART